ncbi:MAG: hypothetical protein IPN20_23305 [Haliscomenobacter sp.]|nr:hypothetical protein [Haliscomenobacter sp.]
MKEFSITISKEGRTQKPDMKSEWKVLSEMEVSELTFEDFAEKVGNKGHSFFHATFKRDIRYENFVSSELIVVDIDDENQIFHPRQALERLREYGLDVNLIYKTMSDPTTKNILPSEWVDHVQRFRMVFILTEPINNIAQFKDLLFNSMYPIFPEADRCHATQIWAGGNGVVYLNEEYRLSPRNLMNAAHCIKNKDIKTTQKKSEKFKKELNSLPANFIEEGGDGSKMSGCNSFLLQPALFDKPLRGYDWQNAISKFKLLDDFLNCKRKIEHNELRGLYSGMKRIRGGARLWREAIRKNKEIDDVKICDVGKWIDDYESRGLVYHEEKIKDYAPQNDPAYGKYEKLTDIHFKRSHPVKQTETHNFSPIADAKWALQYIFKDVMEEKRKGTYVIKFPTGIGKTEQLLYVNLAECIIAAPTHALKNEISERLNEKGIKYNVIPELPKLPKRINAIYQRYIDIGAVDHSIGFLYSLKGGNLSKYGVDGAEEEKIIDSVKNYFDVIENAGKDTLPILTTHKRILHTEYPLHSCLIIDEDILERMGETFSIPMKAIRIAMRSLNTQFQLYKILSALYEYSNNQEKIGSVFSYNDLIGNLLNSPISISKEEIETLVEFDLNGEILSLLRLEYFMITPIDYRDPEGDKNVHFIVRNQLPEAMKKIIFSATANESIHRILFPDVEFYDYSLVESVGTGIQYSNRGFSRSTFLQKENTKILQQISDYLGHKPVITYKNEQYKSIFKNPRLHLDNTEGTNELCGQDMAVVGTPNKPYYFYLLWAAFLDKPVEPEEAKLESLLVDYNGFNFNYMTFKNEELRKIQFHFIESSLIQAVGRARTLNTPAKVEVFSNFPLVGFEQRHLDDLLSRKKTREAFKKNCSIAFQTSGSLAS